MGNEASNPSIAAAKNCSKTSVSKSINDSNVSLMSITDDISSSQPQPRAVFLSIFYLMEEWEQIHCNILFNSICIFVCKREWIFQHNNHRNNNNSDSQLRHNFFGKKRFEISENFKECLRIKEKHGLLLWLDPIDYIPIRKKRKNKCTDFNWMAVSKFLQSIIDPMTGHYYPSLKLDRLWWERRLNDWMIHDFQSISKNYGYHTMSDCISHRSLQQLWTQLEHCSDLSQIRTEICNGEFNFKAAMEIIHQSIPTLIPMVRYNARLYGIKQQQSYDYIATSIVTSDAAAMKQRIYECSEHRCIAECDGNNNDSIVCYACINALAIQPTFADKYGFVFVDMHYYP